MSVCPFFDLSMLCNLFSLKCNLFLDSFVLSYHDFFIVTWFFEILNK